MCAFAAQTVNTAKNAAGYVRVRTTVAGTPVEIGRVISMDKVDLAEGYHENPAWNIDGTSQIAAIFKNKRASGKVEFTIDELTEQGNAMFGEEIDVELLQIYPKNATKAFRVLYAKAVVEVLDYTPTFDRPSTMKIRITPYNVPGTDAYVTEDDYTV